MAAFDATGCGAVFLKILVVFAVLIAGTLAGRLSIERPAEETIAAARRDLTAAEKQLIAGVIRQQLNDATLSIGTWPPLILLNRAGITDYCGVITALASTFGFYAQLVFPRHDPREKLRRVNLAVVATPDDIEARNIVNTACLRYGYSANMPATP